MLVMALIALAGCDFPNDANGTLERVGAAGVLTVGYAERPPWVDAAGGEPSGIEPQLVRRWADELGVQIAWVRGSESTLVQALEERRIDLMIAGLTDASPWTHRVGPSNPYHIARVVVAVPAEMKDLHQRTEWAGRRIAYQVLRPDFAALIAGIEGRPEAAERIGGGPAAIYAYEASDLELVATPGELKTERLVMFVPPGESAMLLALDRFLAGVRRRGVVAGAAQR